MSRDEVAHLPRDGGEVRRLDLDDEVAAEDIDDIAVQGDLDLVAGFDVSRSQGRVEVSFVERANRRADARLLLI